MSFPISTVIKSQGMVQDLPVRKLQRLIIEVQVEKALFWQQRILPLAFAPNAASTRGYPPLTKKTIAIKRSDAKKGLARYGGRRQYVHTGRLQDKLTKAKHSISRNQKQAVVQLQSPSYLKGLIAQNILKFVPSDIKKTDEVGGKSLGKKFDGLKNKSTKRIR